MHLLADGGDGQTPIEPDEALGLTPSWISTRGDLDRAEQDALARALGREHRRRRTPDDLLDERFVRQLHARMYGDVWSWAGRYRTTSRNIGVAPAAIAEELAKLLGDARYWVEHDVFDPDELGVRFHHRLVWIHPFPNGNGRHSREAADLLVVSLGRKRFSWGSERLTLPTEMRAAYIAAMREADQGRIAALLEFARS